MEFHLGILLDYSKRKKKQTDADRKENIMHGIRRVRLVSIIRNTQRGCRSIRSIDWTVRLPFAPFHTGDVGIVVFFPVVVVRLFIYTEL